MNDSRLILESIINNFLIDKFNRFFREKSRQFVSKDENYPHYNDDNFKNGLKLGDINFSDGDKLIICAFEVQKELSERAGKKAQYEKAKNILKSTENQKYSAGIFIYYDLKGNFRFSLIYPESIGTRRQWNNFRRFTYFVSKDFTNKTFLKQIGEKDFTSVSNLKEAFSLSAVTEVFYKEFFDIYKKVVEAVSEVNKISDEEKARDFVLLFSIRIIFIGFIQKKKWIGNDEKFIQNFLREYKNKYFGENKFYISWLSPLFFEALNSPQGRKVAYGNNNFSKETESNLQMAPYLNGGLFKEKNGYDTNGWIIPDKEIVDFFDFLFAHSFTIEENSLEDEDLQLNPEFLGIIFERLVNKADGAVYTPRTEVDLMCRMSLLKWLQKNLENQIKTDNLYELFFRESENAEEQKNGSFSLKEANEILEKLGNIAICDPAVGSGAFLVGMMQVIDDVEQSLKRRFNLNGVDLFERKKQIIKNSLYGVEVKEWAVWICQLRLWLSLFVDASDDLKDSPKPILPSLDFKVRQGDSLIQRVGSKAFPVSGHNLAFSKSVKDKITKLKYLKLEYFDNKSELKDWELRQRELVIYDEILDEEVKEKEEKWRNLKNIKPVIQQSLLEYEKEPEQSELIFNRAELEELETEINELREQKKALHAGGKPLVWGIEFAEVFAEKNGFDIIIGNPPYVRQEYIGDPTGKIKDNKEYKKYLQEMVKMDFPESFSPNAKINAQSDLYAYFYIRGIRLLNSQGIHTYICSNSWLDVGYGVWLQKFLLENASVELIIDNHAKRSFEAADVNTIISIIHAPQKMIDEGHIVKFVAFKRPFEETIYTENMLAIENAEKIESNNNFRVYPIAVKELIDSGMEYEENTLTKKGSYVGDKWGGKYLRAPDFFFHLIIKENANFYKCKEIAQVLGYVHDNNTGNAYEKTRFIKSIKNTRKIQLLDSTVGVISYGVKSEGNSMTTAPILIPRTFGQDHLILYNDGKIIGKEFYKVIPNSKEKNLTIALFLNSTFFVLERELFGITNLGGGGLKFSGDDVRLLLIPRNMQTISKEQFVEFISRTIKSIFEECGIDPKSDIPIQKQEPNPMADRAELDKIVFDALDLTEDERKEVYRSVCQLVWDRISKANSIS